MNNPAVMTAHAPFDLTAQCGVAQPADLRAAIEARFPELLPIADHLCGVAQPPTLTKKSARFLPVWVVGLCMLTPTASAQDPAELFASPLERIEMLAIDYAKQCIGDEATDQEIVRCLRAFANTARDTAQQLALDLIGSQEH